MPSSLYMIPFDKPKHIGYSLSCYDGSLEIYSIPLSATTDDLRRVLGRDQPINAEPLTSEEFRKVFAFVPASIVLGWHERYEFLIHGMNLPLDWK